MHLAAEAGNVRFLELALQGKAKKEIIELLHAQTKDHQTVLAGLLTRGKVS
jgi:hypothetical protein